MLRPRHIAVALLLVAALAACGDDTEIDAATDLPAAGDGAADPSSDRCDPSVAGCDDTPAQGDDPSIDEPAGGPADAQQLRADAQYYLGLDESALPDDVRVARRGEEDMALTDDYVVGRMTVELDDADGDGSFEVVSVTVELPDGPEVFSA